MFVHAVSRCKVLWKRKESSSDANTLKIFYMKTKNKPLTGSKYGFPLLIQMNAIKLKLNIFPSGCQKNRSAAPTELKWKRWKGTPTDSQYLGEYRISFENLYAYCTCCLKKQNKKTVVWYCLLSQSNLQIYSSFCVLNEYLLSSEFS